jgi:hypothetical protein
LLAIFIIVSLSAVNGKSATYDEPLHLTGAWYQTHGFDFHSNPEDPALWKYYAAAGLDPGDGPAGPAWIKYVHDARLHMIWLGAALGALIAWWTWQLARPVGSAAAAVAGTVALAAFALDPNFLGHSPLVKNDVPISLAFLALMAAIWRLGESVNIKKFLLLGFLLGVALTTKFSGVLGIPLIAVALGLRALLPKSWSVRSWNAVNITSRLAVAAIVWIGACLIAYGIIWTVYAFRFGAYPDGTLLAYPQVIREFAEREAVLAHGAPIDAKASQVDQWASGWPPDRALRAVEWMIQHRLFPDAWLYGFAFTYATTLGRPAFLLGQIRFQGWWYYFPLAMTFKTPLATLAAIVLAGAWGIRQLVRRNFDPWSICAAAIFPVFYMFMAMRSNLNLGIRHVFPLYPFLFILIGVAAARCWQRWPKQIGILIAVLLTGLAAETVAAYPDYIAFFNVAAGGERGGIRLLSDSNLDWGQDLPELAQWQSEHPERQLYLCYFGVIDPRYYGLHYINLPGSDAPADQPMAPTHLQPAVAISATMLQDIGDRKIDTSYYDPFTQMQPIGVLGGSIYIFDFPPQWLQQGGATRD